MILFEVNAPRITIDPFECNAPGPVDVQAVTHWLTPEHMEVEPWHLQIAQMLGLIESIEPPQYPCAQACKA